MIRVALPAEAHGAEVEADLPRGRRAGCESRRRPVGRHSSDTWETGSNGRTWERLAIVHKALQLLEVRHAPVAVPRIPALALANPRTVGVCRTGRRFVPGTRVIEGGEKNREGRAIRVAVIRAPGVPLVHIMDTAPGRFPLPDQPCVVIYDRAVTLEII